MTTTHQEGQADPPVALTIAILIVLLVIIAAFAFPHLKSSLEGAWDELWYWLTRCCL